MLGNSLFFVNYFASLYENINMTDYNLLLSGAFEFHQRHTSANIMNTTKEILEK